MTAGDLFLWLAAAALAASFLLNLRATLRRESSAPPLAGWLYLISALGFTAASVVLWALLFAHRFDVAYVYGYTSRDLAPGYIFSAFWAGPEGSFLFWALIGAWTGVFLKRTTKDLEPAAMSFWCLSQGLLTAMLLINSPFAPLNGSPPDGAGLNPILQDPWMAIHPPVLFFGFVVFSAPAALAAAGLLTNRLDRWATLSLPWASLGWLSLGAGLVLGGLWAYETLGWGGYWGWDPVENSSLVPWLTGTVLLHGLILQRIRGTGQRPNVIYALLTYLLILYSTFLTRSGVLGDFSVHSFSDLGVAGLLAGAIGVVALIFLALLVWRFSGIPAPSIIEDGHGKELNHYLTSWVLSIIAFFVLLGTSAPLLTGLLSPDRPSGVQVRFYNVTGAPLALGMLLLIALCPLMSWSPRASKAASASLRRNAQGLAVTASAVVVLLLLFVFGAAKGSLWSLGVLGAAVLILNGWRFAVSAVSSGALAAGAYLAHAGIGLMFVGIAGSNLGHPEEAVVLQAGESKSVLGWTIKLDSVAATPDGVMTAHLHLARSREQSRHILLTGKPMPGGQGYAFKPYIHRSAVADVYFAPHEMVPAEGMARRPSPAVRPLEGSMQLAPAIVVGDREMRPEPASAPDGSVTVRLEGMSVESGSVEITVIPREGQPRRITLSKGQVQRVGTLDVQFERYGPMEQGSQGELRASALINVAPAQGDSPPAGAAPETQDLPPAENESGSGGSVSLSVSTKPLISLLWLGSALAGLGSLLAVARRFREASTQK
ncbi:MAG: cytochrome c assembly protein [Armatimonadota bacterium]|nr:MAG: cytochrome c assembly protein [Armatimonadota bacterium]